MSKEARKQEVKDSEQARKQAAVRKQGIKEARSSEEARKQGRKQ